MKRGLTLLTLALAACTTQGPGASTPNSTPSAPASAAAKRSAPASKAPATEAPAPVDPARLPPADRIFFAGGLVLGADGKTLWARAPGERGAEKWRVEGEGVVHQVVYGDVGDGPRFYVTRGVGRGFLQAPLVLQSLDPATGQATELWRNDGERNEPVTLAIADVNRDGRDELAFSHYASKYMVRTRHLKAGGVSLGDGPEVRMATTRVWGDLDADGKVDEVLGRVYGDAKDLPGDLRIDRGKGLEPVPVQNGIKSAVIAKLGDDPAPALYFCDGWVANYGKEAHARLERARFVKGKVTVETLGASADEFTFFSLQPADVDGDGKLELVAQGDKRITIFRWTPKGPFSATPGRALEPVLNIAVGVDETGRAAVYVPGRPQSSITPLK